MSTIIELIDLFRPARPGSESPLARAVTRSASKQTYYTIRLLADHDLADDAYRAYAYFRWVDDVIDSPGAAGERIAFAMRQRRLLEWGYRAAGCDSPMPGTVCPEERLLLELIAGDAQPDSGLKIYLHNMMAVMVFDAERRGRAVIASELAEYSRRLATAVMGALLYFIGHDDPAPAGDGRYAAVIGAHVIHMLRDMAEDSATGYVNVSTNHPAMPGAWANDPDEPAVRDWVRLRVALARNCFHEGRAFIARLANPRRRLAGFAYVARFEWIARQIERDGYRLRQSYRERKSLGAGLWMAGRTLVSFLGMT